MAVLYRRNLLNDTNFQLAGSGSQKVITAENSELAKAIRGKRVVSSVGVNVKDAVVGDTTHTRRIGLECYLSDATGKSLYFGVWKMITTGLTFNDRVSSVSDIGENFTSTNAVGVYNQIVSSNGVQSSKPKIELGDIATPWTPSPYDLGLNIVDGVVIE